jgi:hypothetical protein
LADVRSSAYPCGYHIDLQLLSRSFYFSRLRASFWVSHIIEQSDARRSGNKLLKVAKRTTVKTNAAWILAPGHLRFVVTNGPTLVGSLLI